MHHARSTTGYKYYYEFRTTRKFGINFIPFLFGCGGYFEANKYSAYEAIEMKRRVQKYIMLETHDGG